MASWHIGLRELCLLAVEFALATAFVVAFAAAMKYGRHRRAFPCARPYGAGSERSRVGLARADADGLINPEHEDFSIANLAGFCGCCNGLDDFVDLSCSRGHLNLELR
jgi:hypothetical protein